MHITDVPPPDWNEDLQFPTLSTGFAHAARTTGQRALYATDGSGRALVLLRALPGPFLRWWTTRAKAYVQADRPAFVRAVVEALRARGASYVRLGDSLWGLPPEAGRCDGMVMTTAHRIGFDATVSDEAAFARMEGKTRAQIRKSERAGVRVEEVADETGLADFCGLLDETQARMRARQVTAALPRAYFTEVFRQMVPQGQAVFLLGRVNGRAVAGGLFLVSPDRMTYYVGASTRDRALTATNGPSAVFWHAMRLAHKLGLRHFDLGAVTPTDDPTHPHHSVYHFKQGFGGTMEQMLGGEVELSPLKCRFQDHVVRPAWKRLYPFYLRMTTQASMVTLALT
jgi:hypothetical protein